MDAMSRQSWPAGLADMVFTDPPYNVDYEGKTAKKLKIGNDALGGKFYEFLRDACTNMLAVTKGAIYICMSSSELHTLYQAFTDAGGHWSTFVIWAKHHFTLGRSDYQRHVRADPLRLAQGHGSLLVRRAGPGRRVVHQAAGMASPEHPTMKPVELVERAHPQQQQDARHDSRSVRRVGTTLIACEKSRRQARLIELEPKYCDVIVRRWQEFTGEKRSLIRRRKLSLTSRGARSAVAA